MCAWPGLLSYMLPPTCVAAWPDGLRRHSRRTTPSWRHFSEPNGDYVTAEMFPKAATGVLRPLHRHSRNEHRAKRDLVMRQSSTQWPWKSNPITAPPWRWALETSPAFSRTPLHEFQLRRTPLETSQALRVQVTCGTVRANPSRALEVAAHHQPGLQILGDLRPSGASQVLHAAHIDPLQRGWLVSSAKKL